MVKGLNSWYVYSTLADCAAELVYTSKWTLNRTKWWIWNCILKQYRPSPWMTFCNAGNEANAIILLCYTLFIIWRWNYTILNLLLFGYFVMINTNLVITNYKNHQIFYNRNRYPESPLNIKEIPNNIVNIPNGRWPKYEGLVRHRLKNVLIEGNTCRKT